MRLATKKGPGSITSLALRGASVNLLVDEVAARPVEDADHPLDPPLLEDAPRRSRGADRVGAERVQGTTSWCRAEEEDFPGFAAARRHYDGGVFFSSSPRKP